VLASELLTSDKIQAVLSGTDDWFGRSTPLSRAGRRLTEHDTIAMLIGKRYRSTTPIDGRIVVLKPRHAEYDIVALERSSSEIEAVTVNLTDTDGFGQNTLGRLGTTIGEGDGCQGVALDEGQLGLGNERGRNEVTSRTTVDEEDSGLTGDGTSEFDETSGGSGELVDLRSWCYSLSRDNRW